MKRLKEIRIERKLKQDEVSEKLGIGKSTYSKYESGQIVMNVKTLKKACEILNISANYLIGVSDNPIKILDVIELEKALAENPKSTVEESFKEHQAKQTPEKRMDDLEKVIDSFTKDLEALKKEIKKDD